MTHRLAFAIAVVLAGCSSPPSPDAGDVTPHDGTSDVMDARDVQPGVASLVARFDVVAGTDPPAPFQIPFPSDLYRGPDGTIGMLTDYSAIGLARSTDVFATGLAGLDGFGLNTGAMFVIDSTTVLPTDPPFQVDPATLPTTGAMSMTADATAFLIDLDPSLTAANARVPVVAGWHGVMRVINVQPERAVLLPGHRYAAVLTSGIQSVGRNVALSAAPIFAAIRDNAPGARSGAIGMLYGTAVDRVVALMGAGFDRTHIAAVAVFTTQTTPQQLRPARDAIVGGMVTPAPTLSFDATASMPFSVVRFGASAHTGWTATLDAWLGTPLRNTGGQDIPGFATAAELMTNPTIGMAHDAIGVVCDGTFVAPEYRGSTDGRIHFDANGAPVPVNASNRLPMTLILPHGPVPANGFPVVIFGHGLGNQRREMLAIANEMARAGIAVAAIDNADFGQRDMPTDVTSIENGSYHGPDGFSDLASDTNAVATFFGNLMNIPAFRDNIRQSVLDLVQLRRLLANPALDLSFVADEYGGTAPHLDVAHIGYVGHSLGGIIGTVFAATEPTLDPVVLNVTGGAFVTHLAVDAPAEGALVGTVVHLIFGAPNDDPADRFNPITNVIQMILDGADPASYAASLTHPASGRPRDVLLAECLWDETVANSSSVLLASIMGLPQINPVAIPVDGLASIDAPVMGNLPMGATGAFLQNTPCTHGETLDARYGTRRYQPPFPTSDPMHPFPMLAQTFTVRQWIVPYDQNLAQFLRSGFAGAAQISIAGMTPLVDYDDDGWTDMEEQAMATNPFDPTSHPPGTPPHVRDVGF